MSETDFLKLKKHDNVETNTEKFDIENYLNGNWDKINKNAKEVNTEISNINSNNTELEKELKEAQEDFYQNSIRGQVSGEYIHVEDSSNCRAKIGIGGNQEQETRSGKNYLNTLAKYKAGEKVTVDGITYIFNEDGSITGNGTATADSVLTFSSNLQTINGSGKKIVGMITGTQVPAKLSILAYTSDWSKNTFELLSSVNKNITINMQENIDYTIFRIIVYKGTTLNNQTIYYQILDTSVNDLTYEQYGVSPSPDYLSKVVAVGGNVQLLDKNNANKLSAFINGDTKVITSFESCKTLYVSCVKNTYYTVKRKVGTRFIVGTTTNKPAANITCNQTVGNNTADSITIKTSNTDNYLVVFYYNSGSDTLTEQEILDSIKIVEGVEAGEYSKYGQGCVKVTKCNKNLFDENNKLMNATINSNGIIATGQDNYLLYFPVKYGHKYIFSTDFSESLTTNIVFGYCNEIPSIGVLSTYNVISLSNLKNKIFTPINEQNKYLCIRLNYKTQYNKMSNIQLEENTVSTSCEEHQEQSYIMPVQKEMLVNDYLDYDNEEEVHVWKKLILTGNEVFTKGYDKERVSGFYTSIDELKNIDKKRNDTLSDFLCNCLIEKKFYTNNISDEVWGNVNTFAFSTANQHILALNIKNISTVDELKTYLKSQYDAGTPVIIYYQLATPQRIAFTKEQKAVAKELNNARTYKNVTNITTDSKAILDLDYAKDLETLLTSKESEV